MYRSISAFSYTVPEVFETTGTVGGEPETAGRGRGQRGIHDSGGSEEGRRWTRRWTWTYWRRRTLWEVFSRERDEEEVGSGFEMYNVAGTWWPVAPR
jgi:hypothetical protein